MALGLAVAIGLLPGFPAGGRAASAWEASPERSLRLAQLFSLLGNASTAGEAEQLDRAIWALWMHSGDADTDSLMREAMLARHAADPVSAMRALDELIARAPEFAEGWNQRATLHYEMGNDAESLADIAQTLRREPRHYGALAGRAMIAIRRGDVDSAIASIREAQRLHPFLGIARLLPRLMDLRRQRDGRPV
ncbi:MAG: hypothetical protein R3E68_01320 [Burkholderiaceae bacterium]